MSSRLLALAASIALLSWACDDSVPSPAATGTGTESASKGATTAARSAAPDSSSAPTATSAVSGGDVTPPVASAEPAMDRGTVTVAALLEGYKRDPKAWVGSKVKLNGIVQSYTENTFTRDAKGLHGPDDAGTYFGVYVTDPGAERGADSAGCFLEESKALADVRDAFKKRTFPGEDVMVELGGPIEGSFGAVAPCEITSVEIVKTKK